MTDYNEIADQYHKVKQIPIKKHSEEYTVLKCLGPLGGLKILDLACGDGYYSRLFCEGGAKEVVGIDISSAMIERAKEMQQKASGTTSPECGQLSYHVHNVDGSLDLGQQKFDVVSGVFLLGYATDEKTLQGFFSTAFQHLSWENGRFWTVMINPNLTQEQVDAQRTYGTEMELPDEEPLQDGSRIKIVLRKDDFSLDIISFHWTQKTCERLAAKAGFQKTVWHNMEVDPVAIKEYGEPFWKPFLDNPALALLECVP